MSSVVIDSRNSWGDMVAPTASERDLGLARASQSDMLGTMAKKNAAAVALNRLRQKALTPEERSDIARAAGLVGGAARAAKLKAEQRKKIAQKAAAKRWAKK